MRMETLAVGKVVVPKVLLESLELQDMVRLMEFLKGRQESQGQQSLDLKGQLPEQADTLKEQPLEQLDTEATQGPRVPLRRPDLRSASRLRGRRIRVCHRRTVGNGPPERAPGLRRHLRRRVDGVRQRRRPLLGQAPREACRT